MVLKVLEICIDSVAGAIAAQNGGAHRVELCDNLVEGGTTPSMGMISLCREKVSIDIMVMIRPRGGDFLYDDGEFEVMKRDILQVKTMGITGVVLGILLPDGNIDTARVSELVTLARPLEVTFHRAFDMTPDADKALDELMDMGIERVLTSGQEAEAIQGIDCIRRLVKRAAGRISVMPGGGINENNIGQMVAATAVTECHSTAKSRLGSHMQYQNPRVYMGSPGSAEYERWTVDESRVKALLKSAQ
ncbi:MAG: copper homeostasis protein CutC [Bacteroidia bacterium]